MRKLALLLMLLTWGAAIPQEPPQHDIRLAFTGNVDPSLLGRELRRSELAWLASDRDAVLGSLRGSLGGHAGWLKQAGFAALSLPSQGAATELEAAGLLSFWPGQEGSVPVGRVRVATVCLASRERTAALRRIQRARAGGGQLVIVWLPEPSSALARALVDGGADCVIGQGSHGAKSIESYRGRTIAYSLGDYVRAKATGRACLLKVDFRPKNGRWIQTAVPQYFDRVDGIPQREMMMRR